jgi:hypothetical protein
MTNISIYKKKLLKKLQNNKQEFKLLYNSIFNSVYGDRIIEELLNPLILNKPINKNILHYYDIFSMLDKKKDKLHFLDTIIDLFEDIPYFDREITLYIKINNIECKNVKNRVDKYYSKLFLDLKHNFDKEYNNLHKLDKFLENLLLEMNYSNIENQTFESDKFNNLNKDFCLLSLKLPIKSKLLPIIYKKYNLNKENNNNIKFILPPLYKWTFEKTTNLYSITENNNLIESIRLLKNFPDIDIHYYNLNY